MYLQELKVISVNAHRSNTCIHSLLQNSDAHILLIQEPWYYNIAITRSDTDPDGTPQLGAPSNSMWDIHLPKHKDADTCKVAAYTKKILLQSHAVINRVNHDLANPNTMVLDVLDKNDTQLRILNIYHEVPKSGHGLRQLLRHNLDELVPTILAGDLNTHSPRWSLPGRAPSPWAGMLTDWMDDQGLACANPQDIPTWYSYNEDISPSVLDLILVNEACIFSGQMGEVEISREVATATDHAALLFSFHPIDSLTLIPPPAPTGYRAENERKDDWIKEFRRQLPGDERHGNRVVYPRSRQDESEHLDHDSSSRPPTADAPFLALKELVDRFEATIEQTSRLTLKPHSRPNPKGADWWTDECTRAHTNARASRGEPQRKEAYRTLKKTLQQAKRDWAHKRLHQAVDMNDIWRLAKARKGRPNNAFPPLRAEDGSLVDHPNKKSHIFRNKFFPTNPKTVAPIQEDDPEPLPQRRWDPITAEEITNALKTTSPSSAPGPSGVGYRLLKWAHEARPDALTEIFNRSLSEGTHPWKHATVVVLNKPNKPDYSLAKAYRPISLLECTGKLMEKIVAKRVNHDITAADLLPMSQFGSRPHHNAVDAVATVVHRIQATRWAGRAGALLLFDISGFFDNINPARLARILHLKGFPTNVCDWVLSFLTGRTAALKIGTHVSEPFDILNGTPQGSPLSPVISALYTASLLEKASTWTHRDLTLYVDDGAIYATSATTSAATESAIAGYEIALDWLRTNGLEADPSKTELMTFVRRRQPEKTGGNTLGARYGDKSNALNRITTVKWLRYLGVYITEDLKWKRHVDIMTNRARSTIRGINILGNSVQGLDYMNWRRVYNALVIPSLTYGLQVWYTGVGQKGLIQRMQIAQNEGIRKLTGVFKTTPIEPLQNLTGIPPISYLAKKLMHAYSHRLRGVPPNAKVRTILLDDQCRYWPKYLEPPTNLSRASANLGPSTYRPLPLCTARRWEHTRLTYVHEPNTSMISHHKESMERREVSHIHIFICYTFCNPAHAATYHIYQGSMIPTKGAVRGDDQTQALCRAVKVALTLALPIPNHTHTYLWLPTKTLPETILTLTPHRYTHLTYDTHTLLASYLHAHPTHTIEVGHFAKTWAGTPQTWDIKDLDTELTRLAQAIPTLTETHPKTAMWDAICADYIPSDKPSHVACAPPNGNKPPPAIIAAAASNSRLISSTIFRLATGHCFDEPYSTRFRPGAADVTLCPCSSPETPIPHTKEHVIFSCPITRPYYRATLRGLYSLRVIFRTVEDTARLCHFLEVSNCSILRPLPKPVPRPDPP
jgi:hypothetical protein